MHPNKLKSIESKFHYPESEKIESRPQSTASCSKLNQALDKYNRQLLRNESWGQKSPHLSQIKITPRVSPQISSEKIPLLKSSIIDARIPKEPRERSTSAVRRLVRDKAAKNSVDLNNLNLGAINSGILTGRAKESQSKTFRIRSCPKDKPVEQNEGNVQS